MFVVVYLGHCSLSGGSHRVVRVQITGKASELDCSTPKNILLQFFCFGSLVTNKNKHLFRNIQKSMGKYILGMICFHQFIVGRRAEALAASMLILAVGAMAGDGRQRTQEPNPKNETTKTL